MERKIIININNDKPYSEIAEEMGEEETTVWSIQKRAINKLEVILKKRGYKKEDFFGNE